MTPESRYRHCTALSNADGVLYLDEREPFRFRAERDNRFHSAKDGDTWWGLAHAYFPSFARPCGMWWLLCEFQPEPVVDPTLAIGAGKVIVIPSERLVRMEAFGSQQRRYH